MSLARTPGVSYSYAGQQPLPYERMIVKSHVHVPGAEAGRETDGRVSYAAPTLEREAHRKIEFSFGFSVFLVGAAVIVMAIMLLSAAVQKQSLVKKQTELYKRIQSLNNEIGELDVQVQEARSATHVCYKAAQDLGMVSSEGVEVKEIYAPETRPVL